MADPVDPRVAAFGNIYKTLGPEFKTDWDAVRAKNAELKAYLGTTDYSAQNQEANDFAKLQFALSLMGGSWLPTRRRRPAPKIGGP